MKVALVHYWLVGMRGGEKVLEALCEMFPDADIYTHVYDPASISSTINQHKVFTTFIQKLPKSKALYQRYLPLMPTALEQLDLRQYDLVISSESGPAKGVLISPHTLHICYCHTPMRYLWDMYPDYLASAGKVTKALMPALTHYLRMWDQLSANRVDHFISNSKFIAKRIAKHYRRSADVIYPPVDTQSFAISDTQDDFYLMLGQLVKYKRCDLAIEAFNQLGKPLVVIGYGEELESLKALAGTNIKFLGRQPFDVMCDYYSRCRALIFPGEEDFGIVPVEAMASGRPVIAYGKGGALETVVDGVTGLFFEEQTATSLINAIERFEKVEGQFIPEKIASHAQTFSRDEFFKKMSTFIEEKFQKHQEDIIGYSIPLTLSLHE
ncbi:MAG TPA: glycosyltransferase family 4 protein [Stenomitos sp.]